MPQILNENQEQLTIRQVAKDTFKVTKSEITQDDINSIRDAYDITEFKIYRSGYNVTLQFKIW